MLGRQEPRQPRPQKPRRLPLQRLLRGLLPVPLDAPRAPAAGDVRGDVGHAGVQRPVAVAGGRQPAVRVQHGRRHGVRVARGLHVRVEGGRPAARAGRPLQQRPLRAAADADARPGDGVQEGADGQGGCRWM